MPTWIGYSPCARRGPRANARGENAEEENRATEPAIDHCKRRPPDAIVPMIGSQDATEFKPSSSYARRTIKTSGVQQAAATSHTNSPPFCVRFRPTFVARPNWSPKTDQTTISPWQRRSGLQPQFFESRKFGKPVRGILAISPVKAATATARTATRSANATVGGPFQPTTTGCPKPCTDG